MVLPQWRKIVSLFPACERKQSLHYPIVLTAGQANSLLKRPPAGQNHAKIQFASIRVHLRKKSLYPSSITASISTPASFGKAATPIAARAG